jgi:hypothetical protein
LGIVVINGAPEGHDRQAVVGLDFVKHGGSISSILLGSSIFRWLRAGSGSLVFGRAGGGAGAGFVEQGAEVDRLADLTLVSGGTSTL